MRRLIFFLIAINAGCAYHFGAVKRSIPGSYDRVAVPVFRNNTPETGVETYFTEAMVKEIERGHIANIVKKDQAQVVIEGQIMNIQYLPGATVTTDLPQDTALTKEYRILLNAKVEARRKSDQQVIWSGSFLGEQRYPAPRVTGIGENSMNPLYNHSSRHQNIEVMAKDMMAEAYSRMTENF